jgi:hypothetical protein
MEKINALVELLGEERVDKLKDEIIEVLIEKLRDDLESWKGYIFYPPDYEDIINQAIEEAETKIKKMYVDYYVQQATEKFEEYKNGRN